MEPLLLRAIKNQTIERPPVWMMRQAGRYLQEYRDLKEKYSFLELIFGVGGLKAILLFSIFVY